MSSKLRVPWLPWVLGLFTIAVLYVTLITGQSALQVDPRLEIALIGVVAFVVNVEVPLHDNTISLGYAAGLLTFLILGYPGSLSFEALTALALGGLGGGTLRTWWQYRESRHLKHRWTLGEVFFRPLLFSAQLTLSMIVGQFFYNLLGGKLPLTLLSVNDVIPLTGLILTSIVVYVAMYCLMLWLQNVPPSRVLTPNKLAISLALGLPLPLVIAAAILFAVSPGGFVLMLAALLGLAIAATELGRAELRYHQQVVELQSLSAVNRAMRTNLDLESLSQVIYLQVFTLLNMENFWLILHDPKRDKLTFPLVMHGMNRVFLDERQPGEGEQSQQIMAVLKGKAPVVEPIWLGVPLLVSDRVIGVMAVSSEKPRFTDYDMRMLSEIAAQSGSAIENAQLYQQTDAALRRRMEQLAALSAINKELSSTLNLSNVFDLVLDGAMANTRSHAGILLLRHEREDPLKSVARSGLDTPDEALVRQDVVHRADETGQAVRMVIDSKVQLGVPIIREFDVLGVILLESNMLNAFQPDDISFVAQLATQSTIAFDNIRLVEYISESRNQLQVILDSMHEAVIMFDLDGRVALANPRVEMLLGLQQNQIERKSLDTLLARSDMLFAERIGLDSTSVCDLFNELAKGVQPRAGRYSYQLADPHQCFIDRTMVPVFDATKTIIGLLMVFADATEERELAQAREDLSRMIVHDLRSPLTAISTSMRLLGEIAASDTPLARSIQRTTDISQRALRKLLALVDSLLDIAKMESGSISLDITSAPLRPIIEGVKMELSPLAEELNIKIEIQVPQDAMIAVDTNKIERVLLNLVDNALKYTPTDGEIIVRTLPDGDRLRVDVVDSGPGIPDSEKVRIFDRFQQIENSKSHRRGTGLGLTFCRLTVEAHGGKIWIEDNPAGGSIFAFTLPMTVPVKQS